MKKVVAIVPLKANSRRLPNKNFLSFGGRPLAWHIISSLVEADGIDDVYVFASNPKLMDLLPSGAKYLKRESMLDADTVTGTELFHSAFAKVEYDVGVISHATNPFIKPSTLARAVAGVTGDIYDSAFACQKHKTYAWFEGKPLNYCLDSMAQTQDLSPVELETSGFYVFERNVMNERKRRVGDNPMLVEVDAVEAIDIDYPEDFEHALNFVDQLPSIIKKVPGIHLTNKNRSFNLLPTGNEVDLCIFDLDGVLVDSREVMGRAWEAVRAELGIDISFETYLHHVGRPFRDILKLIGLQDRQFSDVEEIYTSVSRDLVDEVPFYAGVIDGLKKLTESGIKLSVVTSKHRDRALQILDRAEVDFSSIHTPCSEYRGKPAPDHLLLSCSSANVDPRTAVFVGDMDVDYLAALRAGVPYCHAGWGYGDLDKEEAVWFASPVELFEYLVNVHK
tara:strand:+ start:433 stop:1779 length:1347 start_codon:yes stop_codon:yes gene_type:complete